MICSSTRDEFNFMNNDEEFDIGAFLVVKHTAEVRQKYFEDKRQGKWYLFNHSARNYYSVEANLEKGILPSNKLNYHSATVDYWLHNITSFDASLTKNVRLQDIDTVSNPSFLHTVFTIFLSTLGLVEF
ncbi:hypothetical protein ANCDUO_19703 [Ancylostoma duodenale]|uniref:Uncharacterized protein n=1 Tax=Ancylostoma duodenale TaxID=51022 RepID=A0A0C2FNP9_9BILA|nr:hypothetical protein ANCDUO_19703 [Ancylostoma duodenale]